MVEDFLGFSRKISSFQNKFRNNISLTETESYLASHAYSLAERRAFSIWLNNNLGNDPDCVKSIPISVDTEQLFSSLADGIVLCKEWFL